MSLLLAFLGAPPAEPDFIIQLEASTFEADSVFDSGLFEAAPLEVDADLGSIISLEVIFDPPRPFGLSLAQPTPPEAPAVLEDIPFFLEATLPDDLETPQGDISSLLDDDPLPFQALDLPLDLPEVDPTAEVLNLIFEDEPDLIFPELALLEVDDTPSTEGEIHLGALEDPPSLNLTEIPPPLLSFFDPEPFFDASGLVEPTQFIDPAPTPPRPRRGRVVVLRPQRGRFEIRITPR